MKGKRGTREGEGLNEWMKIIKIKNKKIKRRWECNRWEREESKPLTTITSITSISLTTTPPHRSINPPRWSPTRHSTTQISTTDPCCHHHRNPLPHQTHELHHIKPICHHIKPLIQGKIERKKKMKGKRGTREGEGLNEWMKIIKK